MRSSAGCSEPWPAPARSIAARFELADRSIVRTTGTDDDERAGERGEDERRKAAPDRGPPQRRCRPGPEHGAEEQPKAEIGDLVAPERHQPGGDAGHQPENERAPLQRAEQEPQRDRPIGQAHHLPDMLDAPGGRGAEGEGERRRDGADRVPGAVAEQENQRHPAKPEHAELDRVRGAKARIGVEKREKQVRRREDQRLRIGDLRVAREHVRRPPRRFAATDRLRQELQLRIEMRLRVPWHGDPAREPGPGQREPSEAEEPERRPQRPAGGARDRRQRRRRKRTAAGRARLSRAPEQARRADRDRCSGRRGRVSRRDSARSRPSGGP